MRAIKPPLRVSEQGFTLLEIMVVVVIIGLLVAAVAPQFVSNIGRAEINRAKQDLRSIETSLNLYRLDNFRYPTTSEGLEALVTNPGKLLTHSWLLGKVWGPGYATESNYLRLYIKQLRRKLGDVASDPRWITTEPGLGYRWLSSDDLPT